MKIDTFPMQSASTISQVSLLFINFQILRIQEQGAILLHFLFFFYIVQN